MVKDKQPAKEGAPIDLLQCTSNGRSALCHVTSPEVHRNRSDGKNHSSIGFQGSNIYTGKGSFYRRSIDAQIRKTMTNNNTNDLSNSSFNTTMTYCHRCCKSQQIYDQRTVVAANSGLTPLDSNIPLSLKNFTTCSIPCLFDNSQDFFQTIERSKNLAAGMNTVSHHRVRSPQMNTKRTTTSYESTLDLPRHYFKLPTSSTHDAIAKSTPSNPRQEGLYKIHFNTPPIHPLLSINSHKRNTKKQKKSWTKAMFSCRRGAAEDSMDSLASSYKPGNTPLETSEDDLLTVSGEDLKEDGRRTSKTSEHYIGCTKVKTCSRLIVMVLLMLLILVTVVGLLPSLVFWVLSTQQDKYPAVRDGDMTSSADELVIITSSPSIIGGAPELPFIDSEGWASHKQSKYKTIDKPMSFYNAQEFCQKHGGHLVHINSLREQVFVEDYIIQLLRIQNLTTWEDGIGFWIGARRDRGSHEGTCMYDQWKWVDPYGRTLGIVAGFAAFIPGKPDNYYRPEECLFLSYKDRMDETKFLKWDDAPCDLNSVGGIRALCEVETS